MVGLGRSFILHSFCLEAVYKILFFSSRQTGLNENKKTSSLEKFLMHESIIIYFASF